MSNEKPPLGVKPAWMVAWSRIAELCEAIERQYESHNGNTELVMQWASEIGWQCSIIESLKPDGEERFTAKEVEFALVRYGQEDNRFKWGETIKYSPSEVRKVLNGEMEDAE